LAKEKTVLERLLELIPGFHGYKAKEYLREDDQRVREYVYRVLLEGVRRLEDAIARAASYDFRSADALNELLRDLRIAMDKIRWAEHGYAPHYDIAKIREDDLEKIRSLDEQLIPVAVGIKSKCDEVLSESMLGNPLDPKVGELRKLIARLRELILEREKLIREWGGR